MRWFQKCLNFCHVQRQSIDIFINCYQGYYKDGTNGTRDCRCFSITFFLIQLGTMGLFTLSKSTYCFSLAALSLIVVLFIILVVQPYKEQFKAYSVIDAFMVFFLGVMNIVAVAANEAGIKASYFYAGSNVVLGFVSLVPLIYFVVLRIWWIFVKRELKRKLPCFRRADSNIDSITKSSMIFLIAWKIQASTMNKQFHCCVIKDKTLITMPSMELWFHQL